MQAKGKTRTAWLWSFIARDEAERELIAYVFSRNRSGETPVRVLAGTIGKLSTPIYSARPSTSPCGKSRSHAVLDDFKAWLDAEQGRHPPKSPIGGAFGYALGRWNALCRRRMKSDAF